MRLGVNVAASDSLVEGNVRQWLAEMIAENAPNSDASFIFAATSSHTRRPCGWFLSSFREGAYHSSKATNGQGGIARLGASGTEAENEGAQDMTPVAWAPARQGSGDERSFHLRLCSYKRNELHLKGRQTMSYLGREPVVVCLLKGHTDSVGGGRVEAQPRSKEGSGRSRSVRRADVVASLLAR